MQGVIAHELGHVTGGHVIRFDEGVKAATGISLLSLVLAYVAVHGFTLAGLPSYNHAVGNIFNPVVSMIFSLKTLLFAFAVALLPVANALRDFARRASRTSVERLSDRELQVYSFIGSGLSTQEVAAKLNLSVKTIQTYREHIKRKLGLRNATDLIHQATHWVESEKGVG